jgi:hypothetical protein
MLLSFGYRAAKSCVGRAAANQINGWLEQPREHRHDA